MVAAVITSLPQMLLLDPKDGGCAQWTEVPGMQKCFSATFPVTVTTVAHA